MKNEKKFEPKSQKCICIGYFDDSKAYRLFNPSTQYVIIGKDVQLNGISPPLESIEPHVNLNLHSSSMAPIFVTPSSTFVPTLDPSSPSSSSVPLECSKDT